MKLIKRVAVYGLWSVLGVLCLFENTTNSTVVGAMFGAEYWSKQNVIVPPWYSVVALVNMIVFFAAFRFSRLAAFYYSLVGILISWFPVFFVLPLLPWVNIAGVLAASFVWKRSPIKCETTEAVIFAVLPILLLGVSLTAKLMRLT